MITIAYKDVVTLWSKEESAAGFHFVDNIDDGAEEEYHYFDLVIKDDNGNFYTTAGSVIACGPEQGSVAFAPSMDHWAGPNDPVEFYRCSKRTKTVEYWGIDK